LRSGYAAQCEGVFQPKEGETQIAPTPVSKTIRSLFRSPGACIIKLITTVIYGFRNKLECFVPGQAFPA
jgi:hypothetical protein